MTISLNSILKFKYFILVLVLSLLSCEADVREVYLYKKGVLEATSTTTAIKAGETVTYTDSSTKVRAIKWTFQGGSPGSSIDPNVVVKYAKGGAYSTTLEITFVDNTVEKKTFSIEVEAAPLPPVVIVDGLRIYSENINFKNTAATAAWVIGNNFVVTNNADGGYEEAYKRLSLPTPATANWSLAYLSFAATTDISAYTYINMAVRTTSTGKIRFRIKDTAGINGYVEIDAVSNPYGLKRDGNWNMVKIPLAKYKELAGTTALNLTKIIDILALRSVDPPAGDDVRLLNNYTWDIDNVYLSK